MEKKIGKFVSQGKNVPIIEWKWDICGVIVSPSGPWLCKNLLVYNQQEQGKISTACNITHHYWLTTQYKLLIQLQNLLSNLKQITYLQ